MMEGNPGVAAGSDAPNNEEVAELEPDHRIVDDSQQLQTE